MLRLSPDEINQRYPITGLEFYTQGIKIVRSSNLSSDLPHGKRNFIAELSKSSLSRLAFLAQNTPLQLMSMLTLTWGAIYPNDGSMVKRALNRFLTFLRTRYEGLGYIWFLEFQARGAPHLHLLLDISVIEDDREILASRWMIAALEVTILNRDVEAWQLADTALKMFRVHKHQRTWEMLRSADGGRGYVTRYSTKPRQKIVPRAYSNVGRFWGNSRNAKPRPLSTQAASEQGVRLYLRAISHSMAEADVLPKHLNTYAAPGRKGGGSKETPSNKSKS